MPRPYSKAIIRFKMTQQNKLSEKAKRRASS